MPCRRRLRRGFLSRLRKEPKENQGDSTGDFIPLSLSPWTPENVRAAVRFLLVGKT